MSISPNLIGNCHQRLIKDIQDRVCTIQRRVSDDRISIFPLPPKSGIHPSHASPQTLLAIQVNRPLTPTIPTPTPTNACYPVPIVPCPQDQTLYSQTICLDPVQDLRIIATHMSCRGKAELSIVHLMQVHIGVVARGLERRVRRAQQGLAHVV